MLTWSIYCVSVTCIRLYSASWQPLAPLCPRLSKFQGVSKLRDCAGDLHQEACVSCSTASLFPRESTCLGQVAGAQGRPQLAVSQAVVIHLPKISSWQQCALEMIKVVTEHFVTTERHVAQLPPVARPCGHAKQVTVTMQAISQIQDKHRYICPENNCAGKAQVGVIR